MKKILNIAFIALLLTVVFVPGVKAGFQQGLMKLGFFKPDLDADLIHNDKNSTEETAKPSHRMDFLDKDGKLITLKDLKGKVVFINFWATWCGPCIAEMPSIQKLYDKYKDNPEVVFVLLEAEGNKVKAAKFMENKNLTLPVYYPSGNFPQEFFRGSLPTTVILDKEGNIAHVTEGMADYSGQNVVDFIDQVIAMHP